MSLSVVWLWMWLLVAGVGVRVRGLSSDVPSEEFIRRINEAQDSWTAGPNFYPGSSVKNLLNALPMREEQLPRRNVTVKQRIPESFDARKAWRRCRSLGKVREQGNCASAWALVSTGVFSDRQCLAKVGGELSGQNVLSCCKVCGVSCLGGYVTEAFNFLVKRGAPSRDCHPYEMFPCPKISGATSCAPVRAVNPRCRGYCRANYQAARQPYQDMHRASLAYSVSNSSDVIRSEIMSRGPVAAVVDLYEDFLVYKSGVYSRTGGQLLAQHPVKVVGWGVEEDRPYWVVINSWGSAWGDKGVVKVARDSNSINLENRVFAVMPEEPPQTAG